jgi:hypothetical protein
LEKVEGIEDVEEEKVKRVLMGKYSASQWANLFLLM